MIFNKKNNFSEFAKLGDLSKYTLSQISSLIISMKREEKVDGQINYVTWSNKDYTLITEYDLHGNFRRIHSEHWTNPKLDIITAFRQSIK